jgi:Protein of unknown function (DUF1203)
MTPIRFTAMPSARAAEFCSGMSDDYGLAPERQLSPGKMPCRHCLGMVEEGGPMLLVAYRPFPALQPYAETGPIFLHADGCTRYAATEVLPPMLDSADYILRGYSDNDRIVYGSGGVIPTLDIAARASALLARPDIAYVHVRSARNNCYQCRIDRAA